MKTGNYDTIAQKAVDQLKLHPSTHPPTRQEQHLDTTCVQMWHSQRTKQLRGTF